jgi:hypothetical protein
MTTTLQTPVPLLQHHGEFAQLLDLYRTTSQTRARGRHLPRRLALPLARNAPRNHRRRVDRYDLVDNTHLYGDWCPPGVEYVVIRGDSNHPDTANRAAQHGPYDWIYIDADHHEPAVRRACELYRDLAAEGATIVFHDISPSSDPTLQVDRLWTELRDQHDTREIASNDGWGIGIVLLTGTTAGKEGG